MYIPAVNVRSLDLKPRPAIQITFRAGAFNRPRSTCPTCVQEVPDARRSSQGFRQPHLGMRSPDRNACGKVRPNHRSGPRMGWFGMRVLPSSFPGRWRPAKSLFSPGTGSRLKRRFLTSWIWPASARRRSWLSREGLSQQERGSRIDSLPAVGGRSRLENYRPNNWRTSRRWCRRQRRDV